MARINTNTFRFYLSLSFVLQSLLVLGLVGITIFSLWGVLQKGVHIMRVVQPTQMWTEKLRADINATPAHLEHYLANQDEEYLLLAENLWEDEIATAVEKLESFYPDWVLAEYRITWTELSFKIKELQRLQFKALDEDSVEAQRALWQARVVPLQHEVNDQLLYFFDIVRDNATLQGDRLESAITQFFLTEFLLYLALVAVLLVLFRLLQRKMRGMLARVEEPIVVLQSGDLPTFHKTGKDELQHLLDRLEDLTENLRSVKDFALEVGKGNFDTELSVFNGEGEIGRSLVDMRESLRKVDEQDKERDWVNSGYNKFADLIRRYGDNLQKLTEELIKNLVEFLGANQGGFFVIEESPEKDRELLVLRATYAYDRQKFEERKDIQLGEGLLGQAWQEKDLVVLDKLPENYLRITSGLGQSTPNHLVLVPLIANNEIYGMFELASFSEFSQFQIDFLQGLGESVGAAINTVKVNDNTRKLLDESQELTEQMRAQEEEMRQNMEELEATQEEMVRGANEAEAKVTRLNTILNSTADPVITVNANGIIDAFNYAAEALFGYNSSEVIEHNIGILLPEEKVIRRELVETSNSPVERAKVSTRRRMEGVRKGGRRFLAEVAVKDTFYDGQKHFTVLVRDVSNEIGKLDELTQSNNKLKLELEIAETAKAKIDAAQRETRMRQQALSRSVLLMDLKEDGTITYTNELFQEALELNEAALTGTPLATLMAGDEEFDTLWQRVLAAKEVYQQDLQLKGDDDAQVWTRCAFTKLVDEDGAIQKILVIAQNTTAQMELLAQTQAEITRLQQIQVDPEAAGLDAETQQKLQELRQIQLEVQGNLVEIMQRNEGRMRDAINLEESQWQGPKK